MRGTIIASVGVALCVLAATATAEDIQWRPAAVAPAGQQAAAVVLRAPVADASPIQQSSFSAGLPDSGLLVRAKLFDPPAQAQQMPVGPGLQDPNMPELNPVFPAPTPPQDNGWGEPIPPGAVTLSPGAVTLQPGSVDPACCGCNRSPAVSGGVIVDGSGMVSGDPLVTSCCDGWCCHCCDWLKNRWASVCGCCNDFCCTSGDICADGSCAPRSCFWISGEYLLWTVKSAPMPALVTANASGGPPVIGVNGTTVLYGNSSQDLDMRSGTRITIGFGLPCTDNKIGFETSFFYLFDRPENATFSSSGTPSLGRPFTDVGPSLNGFPGNQNAELIAYPGIVSGSVVVRTTSDFWGIEENLRLPICCGCNWKVDFLTGFRFLELNEGLLIQENLDVTAPTNRGAGNIIVVDNFHTRNDFYGGQIGIDGECRWRNWFLGASGKLAMGDMHQYVGIDGATAFANGPNAGVVPGGLLAQQGTNIGTYNRDTFAVVPEFGLKLGYYFTERLRGYVGYDVIYASSVVRPGDQIDTNVNPTYLPRNGGGQGAPLPGFQFRPTDFWAQGVSFGLEWKY